MSEWTILGASSVENRQTTALLIWAVQLETTLTTSLIAILPKPTSELINILPTHRKQIRQSSHTRAPKTYQTGSNVLTVWLVSGITIFKSVAYDKSSCESSFDFHVWRKQVVLYVVCYTMHRGNHPAMLVVARRIKEWRTFWSRQGGARSRRERGGSNGKTPKVNLCTFLSVYVLCSLFKLAFKPMIRLFLVFCCWNFVNDDPSRHSRQTTYVKGNLEDFRLKRVELETSWAFNWYWARFVWFKL